MKKLWIIFLLLIASSVSAQTVVERANEAYEYYDFLTAITLYEEAIDSGIQRNGAIFYNLGSAYHQVDNIGQAMLNYRKAAVYLPRDTDLSIKIAQLRAERTTVTTGETDWLNQLAVLTVDTLTLFELGIVGLVVWTIFFLMLAIAIIRGFQDSNYRIFLSVMGIIMLTITLLVGSRLYVETQRPSAVILSGSATVMSGPGEDYVSIYSIHAGAEVRIMEKEELWVRFALPDGRSGWILEQSVGYIRDRLE